MDQHEVTLLITYDPEKAARPDKWNYRGLFDLLPYEDVSLVNERYVGKAYQCTECGEAVPEDETVWIEPTVIDISLGMDANNSIPYHVECAPNER